MLCLLWFNTFRISSLLQTSHNIIKMSQPEQKKKSNSKARPLPIDIILEALEIDETVPSGLRWKTRPRHHFATEMACKTWNTRLAGTPAGSRQKAAIYYEVSIDDDPYKTHRLVYLLANGTDPAGKHIDHIRADLPLPHVASNLRLATNAENLRNRRRQANNTSGVPGVYRNARQQKWRVQIRVNGKLLHLGYFKNFDDAVAARKAAEEKYFGEFAYDASQSRIASLFQNPQMRN